MISIEDLSEVFKAVFDDDKLDITEESSANDVEGWDSMTHVLLLSAIEEQFGIEFNQKEVRKFQTVGDLLASVNSKLR
jgi:acyl carrier protein